MLHFWAVSLGLPFKTQTKETAHQLIALAALTEDLGSQNPHGCPQSPVTLVPSDLNNPSDLCGYHTYA